MRPCRFCGSKPKMLGFSYSCSNMDCKDWLTDYELSGPKGWNSMQSTTSIEHSGEKSILKILSDYEWHSPTEIGEKCGKNYNAASGWASPKCKKLVEKGIIERNEKGHYKLKVINNAIKGRNLC